MKLITSAVAVATLAQLAYGQVISVPTVPGMVVCQPITFSWSGGTPPYYLSLLPAEQVTAPAEKEFPPTNGNSLTWMVDLGAGTSITIKVTDSQGNIGYSALDTIAAGSSTGCLNASVSDTAIATSTPSPSSTASSSSASGSPTTASTKNAGSRSSVGTYGVAAAMGLVGAALF